MFADGGVPDVDLFDWNSTFPGSFRQVDEFSDFIAGPWFLDYVQGGPPECHPPPQALAWLPRSRAGRAWVCIVRIAQNHFFINGHFGHFDFVQRQGQAEMGRELASDFNP